MTTTAKIPKDLNAAAEQVSQVNERLITQKLADQSKNETVQTVVATQVDLTRQLASAYTSAARQFIA
jgi:hypothetical protein